MEGERFLLTVATIALTFGGFTGLLAGIRKSKNPWNPQDIAGMRMILENAFAASLLSLLPFLILFLTHYEAYVWEVASFCMSVHFIYQFIINIHRIHKLEKEGKPPRMNWQLKFIVLPVMGCFAILEIWNMVVTKSIFLYSFGLMILLSIAGVQFFVFMRYIWHSPDVKSDKEGLSQ